MKVDIFKILMKKQLIVFQNIAFKCNTLLLNSNIKILKSIDLKMLSYHLIINQVKLNKKKINLIW